MEKELWLIWQDPKTLDKYKIGILSYRNHIYSFKYTNNETKEAIKAGFTSFPGFPDINNIYINRSLFTNIEARLPNQNQNDYQKILNQYNLTPESSKLDILRATMGKTNTDTFEFIPAFSMNELYFDVVKTKTCPDLLKCKQHIEKNKTLELETEKFYGQNAVKVIYQKNTKKYLIGYVPHYYTNELIKALEEKNKYKAIIQDVKDLENNEDEELLINVKLMFVS